MLQCFINNNYKSIFAENRMPKINYINKIDETSSKIPRAMHMHEDLVEILFVYAGNGIHMIGNEQYITKKGDLIFYNSGVIHDETVAHQNEWGTYCLGISNLKLKTLDNNMIIPRSFCPVIHSGKFFDEILNLFKILELNLNCKQQKDTEYDSTEFITYLSWALIRKICQAIETYNRPKEIKSLTLAAKVKNYIDKYYKENINLEIIAQNTNANKYYMAHVFKTETGFSPMQYVNRRRIGEAQNLLISTKLSITDIAVQVGYNDSNYFQKVFHKNVGITPGYYRKKWLL